jgi:hypothetical protein
MGKVLLPALLAVLISACAANAIELRSSSDPTDNPFGMGAFAAPEGMTKDKWRKIKAVLHRGNTCARLHDAGVYS